LSNASKSGREPEGLLRYAEAVGESARRFRETSDIVAGGRRYLGGALTTLHHLRLTSDDEHRD
jgi:hypothetical protein